MNTTTILESCNTISIWFWIAFLECIIIIWLLFWIKRTKQQTANFGMSKSDLKKSIGDTATMQNLVNSIGKSRELYKELSKQCHPDKFAGTSLETIAEELFQEISYHKRNYQKLLEIKKVAQQQLNINL